MKRIHAFAFASAALVVSIASGCDDAVDDAKGGAGTTSSTKATGTTSSTTTSSTTGSSGSTSTGAGSGSSSSGAPMPMPFACGMAGLMCDATKEYCEEMVGVVLGYACKPHAPCPNIDTVTCSCLNVAGMMCNSCTTKDGTATMNCGQG